MTLTKIALATEVPPGTSKIMQVADKQIAIFNVQGRYYAIQNNCPHQEGNLGEGELEGTIVTCPQHGWMFDIVTGDGKTVPKKIQTFKVELIDHFLAIDI